MHSWIYPYIKKYKGRMFLSVLFAFAGVLSGAMLLFVSGYLISKSSLRPENILIVYVPIVSVRAFSIMQAAFPYLEKLVSHDIVLRILSQYRKRLYGLLEPQAVFLESRFKTGDLLNVLSDDIEKLQDFYIRTFIPSLLGFVVYIILAVAIGFFDVYFMLFILLTLGVLIFLGPYFSYYKMKKQHIELKKQRQLLYQEMTDAAFGQVDWILSGRVSEVETGIREENDVLLKKEHRMNRWHHFRDAALRLFTGLIIVSMMVWTSFQMQDGSIQATLIAAFVLMMFSVTDAVLPVNEAVEEIPAYMDSLQRMEQLTDTSHVQNASTQMEIAPPVLPVSIYVNEVSYQYSEEDKLVLDNISLTFAPGEKTAILGKSGTGKSTLLKCLAGMVTPDSGTVMLNDQETQEGFLGKYVSVLNQKAHLFHTSIRNNVNISRPGASDQAIKDVLHQAQILDLVESLPNGIHTQMDEMGKRFSGGERQRIAFARILLQDTPIILMDEPTTGMDPKTELALLDTVFQAAKDKTIIWVTHHLAGAQYMDRILFLEDGNIKLDGSHQQLLKENAYYRTLYQMDQQPSESVQEV